ncbi:MAG: Non-hemolytic enterotoxin [Hymenobacter sp.]|nr:Non-hemolytic enterotoxin [Hymenobacter sp.]
MQPQPTMTLNRLVASQPTPQQLVDYANAVITINSYAYAISNQSMPVLTYPPANYGAFTESFAPAKQHALNWTDNIFVLMTQLPVTVTQQAATLFNLEDTMIKAYLNILISDPGNAGAKAGLATSLQAVQAVIQNQVTSIVQIQSSLQTFTTNIVADATTLTTIAAQATTDSGDDSTKITTVQGDIRTLNADISTAQTLLTVAEIGMGVSIFVGLIGGVCCFIPGGQGIGAGLIVLAVAGEAASIAGTVILSRKIAAYQAEIESDQKEVTALNQDIILLNAVSSQFAALHTANVQAQAALNTISQMWTNLDQEIEAVKTELAAVGTDATGAQYQQALTDFQAAETSWADVVAFATALAGLKYNWQDASGTWHDYATASPSINAGNINVIPTASSSLAA